MPRPWRRCDRARCHDHSRVVGGARSTARSPRGVGDGVRRRGYRVLITTGTLVATTVIIGQLVADDTVFARIEAAGADIVQEPLDQDYGLRDCAVRDPAGNLIRIQQRP
ncbi:MAG: hypothetical protein R2695_11390 [Acidimicrobiales bacterium]